MRGESGLLLLERERRFSLRVRGSLNLGHGRLSFSFSLRGRVSKAVRGYRESIVIIRREAFISAR